jgi:hypothetical protein
MRKLTLFGDQRFHGETVSMAFKAPGLLVKPLQRSELFLVSEFRLLHGRFQHADGLVVDLERHRERMAVLAAMGK